MARPRERLSARSAPVSRLNDPVAARDDDERPQAGFASLLVKGDPSSAIIKERVMTDFVRQKVLVVGGSRGDRRRDRPKLRTW